jgi:hypothetical protein
MGIIYMEFDMLILVKFRLGEARLQKDQLDASLTTNREFMAALSVYCSMSTSGLFEESCAFEVCTIESDVRGKDRMVHDSRSDLPVKSPSARLGLTSQKPRAVTYVVRGELAFLFFTGVSVALHPGFVLKWDEGGMSNYGLHIKTVIPYTFGLSMLALNSWRAARLYASADSRSRRLCFVLTTYSAVVLSVMLSSYFYSRNIELRDLHFAFCTLLVVLVGVASLWMYRLWLASRQSRLLLSVQLLGDLLALLTLVGALHVLFLAEMLSNIGFFAFLVRTGLRSAVEDEARR